MLGRFKINYLIMNLDLVKVHSSVENTLGKITHNHYTEIIVKECGDGLGRENTSTLEY